MEKFDLTEYAKMKANTLSGGNKRKFTCAQAILGNPPVMILDEATTGVDPFARRKIWRSIREYGSDSAMILTTHTMEEAEYLSTKIGIMVKGKIKCFGTLQQIKT